VKGDLSEEGSLENPSHGHSASPQKCASGSDCMFNVFLADDKDIFIPELEQLGIWDDLSDFCIAGKASDGIDALKQLRAKPCDLVITNVHMPRLDGFELLRNIKLEGLCSCVALFSERRKFEYARRGIVLGAFDYLVKPLEEQNILGLLARTRNFLNNAKQKRDIAKDDNEAIGHAYALDAENNILALVGSANEKVLPAFREAAGRLRQFFPPGDPRPPYLNHRLYLRIDAAIFEKYPWLRLYAVPARSDTSDAEIWENEDDDLRSLGELLTFVGSLIPDGIRGMLLDICRFILGNPELNISLSAISEKFFINHTYLSNLFRQKTGLHFNEYVTHVRMLRTRYLLENSDMKIYEICSRLGYKDSDYFSRLYKKFSGRTLTGSR
jgi:two-component system response regulator YesN